MDNCRSCGCGCHCGQSCTDCWECPDCACQDCEPKVQLDDEGFPYPTADD